MRILLAVSELHRGRGYPRYGTEVALALARRGHRVTVLTRCVDLNAADRARLDIRRYRVPGRGVLATMALEPVVLDRAFRRLREEVDVTVSIGIPTLEPVVLVGLGTHRGYVEASGGPLRRGSPRRLVEALRPFHRIVLGWEGRMLRRQAPRLIVVGAPRYAEEYPRLYGYPAERVVSVPMGIDLDAFRFDAALRERTRAALGIPEGTPVMLNVAGRSRQKGLDVIARALDGLPRAAPWQFLFAGDASRAPWLARATARLRSEGRVRLLGRVDDIRALYCAADVVISPSRYDPWGLVVTEALACGTPVICTATIGAAAAVRPGANGVLLDDPNDTAALRAAMRTAIGNPPWGTRATIRRSAASLTWGAGAEQLETHLARVAAGPAEVTR